MRLKPAVLFGLLLFYIFFRGIGSHGLIDPVEGVNASIAAHMDGGGNYFVPKIGEALASGSTMGYWWLSVIALKLIGWSEFAVRFFSALSGLGMVWASAKSARPYDDDSMRKSWLAACVCAGMTLCFTVSQFASSHAMYSCLMGIALAGVVLSGYNKRKLVMSHCAIAFAFIVHGFEGLLLPMLAMLIYCVISEDWDMMRDFFTWPGGILITIIVSGLYFVTLIITNPEIIHFMRCQNHAYTFGGISGIAIFLFMAFVPFHGFIIRAVYEVFPREYPAKKSYELLMLTWAGVFAVAPLLSGDIMALGACVPALAALLGRKIDTWLTQRSFTSMRYAVMLNTVIVIPVLYFFLPFVTHNFPVIDASMMSLIPWGIAEGLFFFASWYYTKTRQPTKWARNVMATALIALMPLAGVFNLTSGLYSAHEVGMKLRDTVKGNDVILQYGVNHPSMYFYTLRNSHIIDADLTPGVAEKKYIAPESAINASWGGKGRVFLIMPSDFKPETPLPQNVFHITEAEGLLLLSNQ
ncbi:MAG: hypothetical protein II876_11630 [Synergistaceae bacterium]|nr:hypothetical protein [Synergistaceae bacterium]MBQ6665668.1 hypothetical protein [Synergistaceae bacterium]